jgi:predicted ribosome quality control (RQC) complex YloA/Tae2 family protein
MSDALDACHRERQQEPFEQRARQLRTQLQQRVEKTKRVLSQVKEDLERAEKFEEYKERGDLLMVHLHDLTKGQRQAEIEDPATGEKRLIPLDPTLDAVANAQRYYERYKKLKRGVEKLTARQQELAMELQYLEELAVNLEQAETLEELRELESELELEGALTAPDKKRARATWSAPRRYAIDGFFILVGRNGRQNDALLREARREDYWLHAKDRPGAHVIITSDRRGVVPPQRVLLRAAELAAYYSRGRGSTKVPVTYTRVKYLKKPKGARPGLVLVTREEGTLMVTPKEEE